VKILSFQIEEIFKHLKKNMIFVPRLGNTMRSGLFMINGIKAPEYARRI